MHQYLKAIGFGNIRTRKELKVLLQDVEANYSHQDVFLSEENLCLYERQKGYGQNIGITMCGESDEEEPFELDYYFPYFQGSGVTTCGEIQIEKRVEGEGYFGICEDPKVGISLVFSLQNRNEFLRARQKDFKSGQPASVTFSGLALSGTILFPVQKSEEQEENEQEASYNRSQLLNAARNGDPTAIETLTMDDIDTYSQVSRRLADEDIMSIVDTYFMPYGAQCDIYSIMGEILAFRERENDLTGEQLYQMKLDANELQFDICVPKNEVLGEPEIGRRFKGTIWLQGYISF